jgi:4-aminobutyrate aminotransferase/(S)-3-amino-2-methylpropionate transaminase
MELSVLLTKYSVALGVLARRLPWSKWALEPDIIVTAKSIAAGMPLAAVTGRAELMDKVHVGGIGGTYGGNPLACAAALEVMNQFQDGDLLERSQKIGAQIKALGETWQRDIPKVGDVRGLGSMIAIEFVKDRTTREPDPKAVAKISNYCLQHGVITMRLVCYTNLCALVDAVGDYRRATPRRFGCA